ncbi:hypothetical protein V7111_00550 [Neobacillus niacini]|uniref:hypothetical protein n=1 Tax=Neobacillus niacini TaxID=86668 RepID=UPI002FFEEDCC
MQKIRHLMLIPTLLILIIIAVGCSTNDKESALRDDQGSIIRLEKEKPTLLFFFTGVG